MPRIENAPPLQPAISGLKVTLSSAEHGFDDFDVTGHETVYRACVGHGIKKGDVFNVYGPPGTKSGAVWRGSVEVSLRNFPA